MRNALINKFAMAVLLASVVITGCARSAKLGSTDEVAASVASKVAKTKPPLQVPVTFADDKAKQEFAAKALEDGYYKEAGPLLEQSVANQPDAANYLRLGTVRYNLNNLAGAIEAWNKAASLDSKLSAQVKNNIGNALRDQHKPEEAMASYRAAIQEDPEQWNAGINLASMLKAEGKLSEAIQVLEAATPANPNIEPLQSLLKLYQAEQAAK